MVNLTALKGLGSKLGMEQYLLAYIAYMARKITLLGEVYYI